MHDINQISFLLRQLIVDRFQDRGHDVTAEEWAVLSLMQGLPGLTVTDLAQRSLRDKTTTTRMMDRMIRKGLAERRGDPKDRRVQRLFLTRLGYETHSDLQPMVEDLTRLMMGDTDPKIEDELRGLLSNLVAHRKL